MVGGLLATGVCLTEFDTLGSVLCCRDVPFRCFGPCHFARTNGHVWTDRNFQLVGSEYEEQRPCVSCLRMPGSCVTVPLCRRPCCIDVDCAGAILSDITLQCSCPCHSLLFGVVACFVMFMNVMSGLHVGHE